MDTRQLTTVAARHTVKAVTSGGATVWLHTVVIVGVVVIAGLAVLVVLTVVVAMGSTGSADEIDQAALDIPETVLEAYHQAAAQAGELAEDCRVRWQVLAGIGKVESNHARLDSGHIAADGTVSPPIIGIPLDGTQGTRRVADTDGGRWDDDATWDRAVGLMQFIPGSWDRYGRDGNDDNRASPHNVYDAALAAAAHLCGSAPGDYTDPTQLEAALYAYNHSRTYVADVRGWIDHYDTFAARGDQVAAEGTYALPLDRARLAPADLTQPHHDYPAWDKGVPRGTPVFAVHGGVVASVSGRGSRCGRGVTIAGDDGHRYTYCHAARVQVRVGDRVAAGDQLLASGDTGNSSGPHLHLGIRDQTGTKLCPQPLLEAWYDNQPLPPDAAPNGGCSY